MSQQFPRITIEKETLLIASGLVVSIVFSLLSANFTFWQGGSASAQRVIHEVKFYVKSTERNLKKKKIHLPLESLLSASGSCWILTTTILRSKGLLSVKGEGSLDLELETILETDFDMLLEWWEKKWPHELEHLESYDKKHGESRKCKQPRKNLVILKCTFRYSRNAAVGSLRSWSNRSSLMSNVDGIFGSYSWRKRTRGLVQLVLK